MWLPAKMRYLRYLPYTAIVNDDTVKISDKYIGKLQIVLNSVQYLRRTARCCAGGCLSVPQLFIKVQAFKVLKTLLKLFSD